MVCFCMSALIFETCDPFSGLGMENIGGIFVVLICGLIIAVFVAIMEFVWSTRRSAETDEVCPHTCPRRPHRHTPVGSHGIPPTLLIMLFCVYVFVCEYGSSYFSAFDSICDCLCAHYRISVIRACEMKGMLKYAALMCSNVQILYYKGTENLILYCMSCLLCPFSVWCLTVWQ